MTNTGPVGVYLMTTFTDQLLLRYVLPFSSSTALRVLLDGYSMERMFEQMRWRGRRQDEIRILRGRRRSQRHLRQNRRRKMRREAKVNQFMEES